MSWRKRTFEATRKLDRGNNQIDWRAWNDNENTDLDLAEYEWGLYREPNQNWMRFYKEELI